DGGGSPGSSGCHSRALEGVWVGASSGEDESCLLQGWRSAEDVSEREIRFSGLHVSAAEVEESFRQVLHQLQPGSFRQGGESDSGRDSKLGPASAQRQANRGSVPDVQPEDPRLAPILRAVLSLGAVSADASTGSIAGPLGRAEIQEAARAFAQSDTLGRAYLETRSEVVAAQLWVGRRRWSVEEKEEGARLFGRGNAWGRAFLETRSEVVGALADGRA